MTPPKPTIRDIEKWAYEELEPYFQGEYGTMDSMLEMFVTQLTEKIALLSPQTGEGEKKYPFTLGKGLEDEDVRYTDINDDTNIAEEMEWEKEWDKLHPNMVGLAIEKTEKAFLRKQLDLQEKEICICAAVRMSDGYIVRGHRHNDCYRTITGISRYRGIMPDAMEDGFMTTKNRFVDRKEALKLQIKAGLKSKDRIYRGNELFSEDLY